MSVSAGEGSGAGRLDPLAVPGEHAAHRSETLQGPGDGGSRSRVIVGVGLAALAVVLVLALTNLGHGTKPSTIRLRATMPQGTRVSTQLPTRMVARRPDSRRPWYILRGLRGGDTFTTVLDLTNRGTAAVTLGSAVPLDPLADLFSGTTVRYFPSGTALEPSDGTATSTTRLAPGETTSVAVTWSIRGCPAGSGRPDYQGGTPIGVYLRLSPADIQPRYPVDLPYQLLLVRVPTC